ncbi:roadblock/LC7 domain-containing protein [Engelhardtia mirabilis]|uniref:Roadblock/LC7 domain protein n=1 Tax=Engelhardtia mirabilis TaxID=2528011 RepID=A0A518BNR3_9BACT|nr:Roadblock/LC7 domain protein [Planctomycetes bacterium Pla133]QDV02947.1 Roadblock/LC7 domain protein [Planctomycetes bacterium Pla86]
MTTQDDARLREDRLVFYEADMEQLHTELDGFLELSKSRCAMLIDRDGHMVTRRGEAVESSSESISALIAGSFAATKEMARLLGEPEFAVMFHQGQRDSIQLQLVGERTLLAVVFDERTNLGLVRFYSQEATVRLGETFARIASEVRDSSLSDDFSSAGAAALDDLF